MFLLQLPGLSRACGWEPHFSGEMLGVAPTTQERVWLAMQHWASLGKSTNQRRVFQRIWRSRQQGAQQSLEQSRKERTPETGPAGILLGSGKLAAELYRLDLIDECKFLVHPRIVGPGLTLYQSTLPGLRQLGVIPTKPLRNGAVFMHCRRVQRTIGCSGRWTAPFKALVDQR